MGKNRDHSKFPNAITVLDNGNVGIGTTNPSFAFDVSALSNNQGIRINSVQAAVLYLYSTYNNSSNRNWGIYNNSQVFGDFDIRQSNAKDGDMTAGANSTSRLYIGNTGSVGIGTSSPSDKLTVSGRLNLQGLNQNSVWFNQNAGGTSTGYIVGRSFASNDAQDFFIYDVAAAAFRLSITSGGNVGIGINTPSSKLGVKSTGADGIVLEQDLSDANNSGRLFFLGTIQNYGVFNNAGDLRFTYGAQPANTSGTSLARFTNTGKYFRMESGTGGIQFQGTSSSSNALNYYEEGTWTPILSGSNGGDYTAAGGNSGKYTRIGNVVTITCTLVWSGGGAYSGNLCVRGIPFTNGGNRCHGSMGAIAGGLSLSSGYYFWSFLIDPGYNFAYIIQNSTSYYSHGASVSSSGTVYAMTLTYLI